MDTPLISKLLSNRYKGACFFSCYEELTSPQVLGLWVSDPCDTFAFHQRKEPPMAIFEFSDGFDAVEWHLERMAEDDYDEYYEED